VYWVLALVVPASLAGIFHGGASQMVGSWSSDEYSHAYLIPVLSGLMIWHKREVLANLGRVLSLGGKTQEAITVYRQALAEFPNNQGLMLALAEAQQRADDDQGAMATYEGAQYPGIEQAQAILKNM
jgi:tetratricopeptide (TPR) repeat protein